MLNRTTLIVAILALVCSPALAQSTPDQTTMGKVIGMTETTLSIVTNDDRAVTFRIDEALYPDTLSVGDHVAVRHILDDKLEGQIEATEILISEDVDPAEPHVHAHAEPHAHAEVEVHNQAEMEMETEVETTYEAVETEVETTYETVETEVETSYERTRLPQTATPLAGLAIAGLLSLAGAFGLRFLRK